MSERRSPREYASQLYAAYAVPQVGDSLGKPVYIRSQRGGWDSSKSTATAPTLKDRISVVLCSFLTLKGGKTRSELARGKGLKWGRLADPDVTTLLRQWGEGDATAAEQLIPLVHHELRRIARRHMAKERASHTLQPTALVNEAYLRLVQVQRVTWKDRAHFFAMSARVMRRVLVDFARARQYQKRGGGVEFVAYDEDLAVAGEYPARFVALNDAIEALTRIDPRKGQIIEMRFFAGLSVEDTAQALNVSVDTVMRDWRLAKAWLSREMKRVSS